MLFMINTLMLKNNRTCSNISKNYSITLISMSIEIKNKRPMGHIAHLRKQFKSINTYDYIIILIKRRKNTLLILGELIGSSFEQT